jgi:hypothetical protein
MMNLRLDESSFRATFRDVTDAALAGAIECKETFFRSKMSLKKIGFISIYVIAESQVGAAAAPYHAS